MGTDPQDAGASRFFHRFNDDFAQAKAQPIVEDQFVSIRQIDVITPAKQTYDDLIGVMDHFKKSIDESHVLGAYIASAHVPFQVDEVELVGNILVFRGSTKDGGDIEALQHFTQLSFQLIKLKRLNMGGAQIGFIYPID